MIIAIIIVVCVMAYGCGMGLTSFLLSEHVDLDPGDRVFLSVVAWPVILPGAWVYFTLKTRADQRRTAQHEEERLLKEAGF